MCGPIFYKNSMMRDKSMMTLIFFFILFLEPFVDSFCLWKKSIKVLVLLFILSGVSSTSTEPHWILNFKKVTILSIEHLFLFWTALQYKNPWHAVFPCIWIPSPFYHTKKLSNMNTTLSLHCFVITNKLASCPKTVILRVIWPKIEVSLQRNSLIKIDDSLMNSFINEVIKSTWYFQ